MAAEVTQVPAIMAGAGVDLRQAKWISSSCSCSTTVLPTSLAVPLELHFLPKVGYPGITLPLCQPCYRDGCYSATACKRLSAAAAHQAPPQN